ncbi:DUF3037 domain-containing protein [Acidovorax lacteus]|uniref:DUF3037 domain-containing protein n=1 Tax=Acidovorax lacteus TaxID=1924988 RepID=A0ABP8L836_9BURK
MNTTYHYVVLRLAPDPMRGEVINVGMVLFHEGEPPRIVIMATLNKLRAIDASWDTPRLAQWAQNIQTILDHRPGVRAQVDALGMFGFCEPDAVGSFMAATQQELQERIGAIKAKYVANKATEDKPKREKRTRLQTALREQFKKMQVLGTEAGDLKNHLVVPNVPVPGHDELKSDFVYKNGVYRITQTLDYNVAPDSMHNKLLEACMKSTAGDLAMAAYGKDTQRFAVVDIPEALADAADSHIDLLIARGFEIFRFDDKASMAEYIERAAPNTHQAT